MQLTKFAMAILFALTVNVIGMNEVKAQSFNTSTYHSASLRGKRWVEQNENKYKRWSYTIGDSVIVDSTIYKFNGKTHVRWHLYYLADEVPDKFDFSKIGKNTSGKFIIKFYNGRMGYNEILELDERRFTIRHTYYGDSLVFNRAR